jgi:hypothetical protein
MTALSPAQRRVLEAAQRDGWAGVANLHQVAVYDPSQAEKTAMDIAGELVVMGLLHLGSTSPGRAELGITDTEEG